MYDQISQFIIEIEYAEKLILYRIRIMKATNFLVTFASRNGFQYG